MSQSETVGFADVISHLVATGASLHVVRAVGRGQQMRR